MPSKAAAAVSGISKGSAGCGFTIFVSLGAAIGHIDAKALQLALRTGSKVEVACLPASLQEQQPYGRVSLIGVAHLALHQIPGALTPR
jgi:hypothetical protein